MKLLRCSQQELAAHTIMIQEGVGDMRLHAPPQIAELQNVLSCQRGASMAMPYDLQTMLC